MGTFYNEDINKDDRQIKLKFEVICQSPISMQDGNTVNERIKFLIHQCEEAMDDSMRHWGDFYCDIECTECYIGDEDENDNWKETEINIDELYQP